MKLNDVQLRQVDAQVKRILASDSYYARIYRDAGITKVESQADFERIPFSCKNDLRNAYPLGIQAVPDEEVVRIHSSSGTTGKPVVIPYTAKDVDDWAAMFARCYEFAGVTAEDRCRSPSPTGCGRRAAAFRPGREKLGAMAIPMGPGNTEKQLQMMQDLGATVLTATSSYALLLAEEVRKRGLRDKLRLRKGIFGSERWSEKMRECIRRDLGIELYDIYGLTEIYGPGIGINCRKEQGIHYWDDFIYIEIIDPVTGLPVPDGETGEIVITTLVRRARRCCASARATFRASSPKNAAASCFPRLDTIQGRSDDMFKVRGCEHVPASGRGGAAKPAAFSANIR